MLAHQCYPARACDTLANMNVELQQERLGAAQDPCRPAVPLAMFRECDSNRLTDLTEMA